MNKWMIWGVFPLFLETSIYKQHPLRNKTSTILFDVFSKPSIKKKQDLPIKIQVKRNPSSKSKKKNNKKKNTPLEGKKTGVTFKVTKNRLKKKSPKKPSVDSGNRRLSRIGLQQLRDGAEMSVVGRIVQGLSGLNFCFPKKKGRDGEEMGKGKLHIRMDEVVWVVEVFF